MHVVSIYRSGMNDNLVSTRRLTKQFPSVPDVTAENRKTIFRRPDHVILQSQTVWLPRLYPSILPVYAAKCRCPKPPKGVGFTDPLSGTLKLLIINEMKLPRLSQVRRFPDPPQQPTYWKYK